MMLINGKTKSEYEEFLYGDKRIDDFCTRAQKQWIEKAEKAMGFRLFIWQKMMILGITPEPRQTGKTTAWALRRLMAGPPIDMRRDAIQRMSHRVRFEYEQLEEISKKLDEEKVPHTPICRTNREMEAAMRVYKTALRGNGKTPPVVIIDEIRGESLEYKGEEKWEKNKQKELQQ